MIIIIEIKIKKQNEKKKDENENDEKRKFREGATSLKKKKITKKTKQNDRKFVSRRAALDDEPFTRSLGYSFFLSRFTFYIRRRIV